MTSAVTLTKNPKWADIEVTGNVPTDDVTRMTIDSAGGAHIMSLLTDLYSDPELAVLREYTSNAIDSHRASGQTAPIEVHLPSALSPNFIVQDYGTGMSKDDIKYIYSSYGASTKRDDLNQIGAFGLGCKSALTLTQQFTIDSVKDNKRTIAHILRGADGIGEVSIISHTDLSEHGKSKPNGVKVTIPVPDHSTFTSKASGFFYTWNSDEVLVNNEKPKTLFDLDHITFKPSNGNTAKAHLIRPADRRGWYDKFERGLYFMLSGIRYDVDLSASAVYSVLSNDLRELLGQTALIIEIPIGSVDLVPSREALRYSPRTLANIELFCKKIINDINDLILADVVDAPTRTDAISRKRFWANITRSTEKLKFTWGTEEIPKTLTMKNVYYGYFSYSSRSNAGYIHRRDDYIGKDAEKQLNLAALADSTSTYYVVDQRTPDSIRSYSTMFRDFLRHNGHNLQNAALLHLIDEPKSPWFTELAIRVSIDTMLADAKAFRAAERANAVKGVAIPKTEVKYDLITNDATNGITFVYSVPASQIDAGTYIIDRSSTGPRIDDPLDHFVSKRGRSTYSVEANNNNHVKFLLAQALPVGKSLVIVDRARKVDALKSRTTNVVDDNFYKIYRTVASGLLGTSAADQGAIASVLGTYASSRISPREFAQNGLWTMVNLIDDPEVVDLLNTLNTKTNISQERVRYLRIVAGTIGTVDETGQKSQALMKRVNEAIDMYPLMGVLSGKTHKRSAMLNDLVEYMNDKYGKANKV